MSELDSCIFFKEKIKSNQTTNLSKLN